MLCLSKLSPKIFTTKKPSLIHKPKIIEYYKNIWAGFIRLTWMNCYLLFVGYVFDARFYVELFYLVNRLTIGLITTKPQ